MKQLTTQEIQAILDGRKTQFREGIKLPFDDNIDMFIQNENINCWGAYIDNEFITNIISEYKIGDTLWKDTEHESVVTNVRVERLINTILDDIIAEGCPRPKDLVLKNGKNVKTAQADWFFELYEYINPDNYVFVYEFERVKNAN